MDQSGTHMQSVLEIQDDWSEGLATQLSQAARPVVIRGLANSWPMVSADDQGKRDLLSGLYSRRPVTMMTSQDDSGRIAYSEDGRSLNFQQQKVALADFFQRLDQAESNEETLYSGSLALDHYFPGLRAKHSLDIPAENVTVRIWMGNKTVVGTHYDVMENVACVVSGKRVFTLFPPDALPDLYVGPLDFTPAGQAVSLVDPYAPDLQKYPKFTNALAQAQRAELLPGDGIFIPAMWWHHVQSTGGFNVLINHWWRSTTRAMGAPQDALLHAILEIRDLPAPQREAWRRAFEYYVFDAKSEDFEHIAPERLGVLGELNDDLARQLRAFLRNRLNR